MVQPQVTAWQQSRFPGFDGLRLVAAVLVMFSHAFLIATGAEDAEPLVRLLGDGNILGLYSVFTFFVISGFLLSRSLSANPSATTYVVNRALRIFPGFAFCTVVTAFVIGPMFSAVGVRDYFSSLPPYDFVRTSLAILDGTSLNGLFDYADSPDLAPVVNGSLWSLHYEALSYVFLLLVWAVSPSLWIRASVTSAAAFVAWAFPSRYMLQGIAYTLPYFAAGVGMHWIHGRHRTRIGGAAVAVVLLIGASLVGLQHYAFAPLGAYLIVFIGERSNPASRLTARIGDCSYGLYLYGWPAEQIIKQVTGTTDPMTLFALALPVALACALISCHLVEAPAMRLRGVIASSLQRRLAQLLDRTGDARHITIVAARASFVATALVVLCTERWWYFAQSMVEILLWTLSAAAIAAASYHAASWLKTRRSAVSG